MHCAVRIRFTSTLWSVRPVPVYEYCILISPSLNNCKLSSITPKADLFGFFMTDSAERWVWGKSFPRLCIPVTYEIFREGKMSSIHLKCLTNCLLSESCRKQLHVFTWQVCLLLDLLPWILAALNDGLFVDTFPLITHKKSRAYVFLVMNQMRL